MNDNGRPNCKRKKKQQKNIKIYLHFTYSSLTHYPITVSNPPDRAYFMRRRGHIKKTNKHKWRIHNHWICNLMDDTTQHKKIIISCVETVKKKKTNHSNKITNNFIYVEWNVCAIFTVRLIYSNWKNKYVSIDVQDVKIHGKQRTRSSHHCRSGSSDDRTILFCRFLFLIIFSSHSLLLIVKIRDNQLMIRCRCKKRSILKAYVFL